MTANGEVLYTTSRGREWKLQEDQHIRPREQYRLNDCEFITLSEGCAVGSNGLLVHNVDGGKIRTVQENLYYLPIKPFMDENR
jgi:photosystem II stability/assembly factor-like uncharacterized protein